MFLSSNANLILRQACSTSLTGSTDTRIPSSIIQNLGDYETLWVWVIFFFLFRFFFRPGKVSLNKACCFGSEPLTTVPCLVFSCLHLPFRSSLQPVFPKVQKGPRRSANSLQVEDIGVYSSLSSYLVTHQEKQLNHLVENKSPLYRHYCLTFTCFLLCDSKYFNKYQANNYITQVFDFKRVSGGILSNTGHRGRVSVHWSCHTLSWNLLCDHVDVKRPLCCTCPRFLTLNLTNGLSPEAAGIQLMCNQKSQQKHAQKVWVLFFISKPKQLTCCFIKLVLSAGTCKWLAHRQLFIMGT